MWELAEMIPYIRFAYFLYIFIPISSTIALCQQYSFGDFRVGYQTRPASLPMLMSSTDMFNVIINLKFKIPSKMSIELQYPKGGKRNDASCWWLISSVAGYCKIIDFYFKPFHQLQWLQWGQGERVANRCKLTKRIWRLFLFFDTCRQLSPQKNENTDDWW